MAWHAPVLIVEDDPLIAELLTLRLEAAGYKPYWEPDGEKALAKLQDIGAALIILDLGLPGMDGFQVLTEIRRQPIYAKTPVVVLTARHNAADVQRALKLGANDFMAKPFDAAVFMRRMAKHLSAAAETHRVA
jgi:DNA-binding response OmpR family regulator